MFSVRCTATEDKQPGDEGDHETAHLPSVPARPERHGGAGLRTLEDVSRRLLAIALLLGGMLAVMNAEPATACSCVGPPQLAVEFTGEAIGSAQSQNFGKLWSFRATVGSPSVNVGDVVEVNVDGDDPPDAAGLQSSSSCSIGPNPLAGGIYAVGAYRGSNPDESPRYFTNSCGGYLRQVLTPSTTTEVATPVAGPRRAPERKVPIGPPIAAGLAICAVGILSVRASRR